MNRLGQLSGSMRLFCITEGVVDTAQGDIVNTKNEIASKISEAIITLGFPEPDVEFADTPDDDANVFIEMGRNRIIRSSQVIMIQVVSDDDITIRVPAMLSEALKIHDYYKLSSSDDAILALQKIKTKIHERLLRN